VWGAHSKRTPRLDCPPPRVDACRNTPHQVGNSNSHGARLVHLIITMIKWIRTSRLSIKNSLTEQVEHSDRVSFPILVIGAIHTRIHRKDLCTHRSLTGKICGYTYLSCGPPPHSSWDRRLHAPATDRLSLKKSKSPAIHHKAVTRLHVHASLCVDPSQERSVTYRKDLWQERGRRLLSGPRAFRRSLCR